MPRNIVFRRLFSVLLIAALVSGTFYYQGSKNLVPTADAAVPIYLDYENYSFEERAADLVSKMTLQEKLSQMISSYSVAIPRLGVQPYAWWNEALHGVSRIGHSASRSNPTVIYNATSYPIGFSMGGTWDPDLMYRVSTAIGDETREVVPDNNRMLTMYSPTINLARDPRWGRNDEAFSEDPYLTAAIASQFVNGLEGKDKNGKPLDPNGYLKVVSTIKHYLANNSEVNRLNGSSNLTEQELREYYSYVYRLIIQKSGVTSVMSAYNRINNVPGGINPYTLDTLLRQTFGFTGYVTSDCDSVHIAVTGNQTANANQKTTSGNGHGWRIPGTGTATATTPVITYAQADAWAIMAGADLECNTGYGAGVNSYEGTNTAQTAISSGYVTPFGKFTEDAVDVDVVKLFTTRMKLGEFDSSADTKPVTWYNQARERITQNYGADWVFNTGNTTRPAVTMTDERLALAREAAAKAMILLKNNPVNGSKLLPLNIPSTGDIKIAVYGSFAKPNAANESFFLGGYSSNRNTVGYANMVTPFTGISNAIKAINPNAQVDHIRGFTGTGFTAIDAAAIARAGDYDLCIVIVADDQTAANEGSDRSDILLKGAQASLIQQVAARNPKMVTVIQAFSPIDTTDFDAVTPALLFSSFNGDRNGEGIADVLLGNYNPSGRTSTVWYRNIEQIGASGSPQTATRSYRLSPGEDGPWPYPWGNPNYGQTYSYGVTNGRTYMYYNENSTPNTASGNTLAHSGGSVRYPFGYGLSYTDFEYSNLRVEGLTGNTVSGNGTVKLTFDVKNTGSVKGADVAELFVKTPSTLVASDRTYAIKRLKGFERVELEPNQTKTVSLSVSIPDLAFYNETSKKFEVVYDKGAYTFQISHSSADSDVLLSRDVTISGPMTPTVSVVSAKPVQEGDKEADIPNRLIYSAGGTVIDPQITVNMSDDVLYGYVNKNESKPLPANLSVYYSSNRLGVVSVDNNGVIKTNAGGVATITATVTDSISGTSGSCEFVVVSKLSDDAAQLKSISVDGVPLDDFDPTRTNYNVRLADGTTAIPVVTYEVSDPTATVEFTPIKTLPGYAQISVQNGTFLSNYFVGFGFGPRSSPLLDSGSDTFWQIAKPGTGASNTADGLLLTPATNANYTLQSGNYKNLYLQPTYGDMEATVDIQGMTTGNGLAGGLVYYQSDNNHLRLVLRRTSAIASQAQFINVVNGAVASTITANLTGSPANITLRLTKTGDQVTAQYSLNGTTWINVGTAQASYYEPKVGVYASNEGTAALTGTQNVTFKNFVVSPMGIKVIPSDVTGSGTQAEVIVSRSSGEELLLILAFYDENGRLYRTVTSEGSIPFGKSGSLDISSETPPDVESMTIKVFVWDPDTCVPLIAPTDVPV